MVNVADPVDHVDLDFGVDPDAPYHDWMFQSEVAVYDPVDIAADLQSYVADLPDHTETFRLPAALPDRSHAVNDPTLVELTGAWPVPAYVETGQSNRYVNPNSPSASYYAGVFARCDCGGLMVRQQDVSDEHGPVTQGEHDHAEDCPKDARLRARADIAERRREVFKRVCHLGHSVRGQRPRLGIDRDSLTQEVRDLGLSSIGDLRLEGRKRIARTAARLLVDHSPKEIGAAYGRSDQEIRRLVREHTEADARELYRYRRSNKTDHLSRMRATDD